MADSHFTLINGFGGSSEGSFFCEEPFVYRDLAGTGGDCTHSEGEPAGRLDFKLEAIRVRSGDRDDGVDKPGRGWHISKMLKKKDWLLLGCR